VTAHAPSDGDGDGFGDAETGPEHEIYKENILDHYKRPRNRRVMQNPTLVEHGLNPSCGDQFDVYLRLEDDCIAEVSFIGGGCAISQASMSMLTELLKGKRPDEVVALGRDYVVEMLGIPIGPVRMKCAMLGLRTTQSAIGKSVREAANEGEQHE